MADVLFGDHGVTPTGAAESELGQKLATTPLTRAVLVPEAWLKLWRRADSNRRPLLAKLVRHLSTGYGQATIVPLSRTFICRAVPANDAF
jgi:hypothetical protein